MELIELKIYLTVVMFIFGACFGSFFCVIGWRLPKGLSIVKPGSFCPKCKHSLKWYELIPVLSYLIQGGKCRKCHTKIPPLEFFMEILTGALFAISFYLFEFSLQTVLCVLVSSFLIIVIISDVNYLIIPDQVTIFFIFAVLLARLILTTPIDTFFYILYGLIAFVIMFLFMLLGNFIFKKETLGGGDIKLMFFVGCTVGIWMSFLDLFISSFFALPMSLYFMFRKNDNVIPFGPFILIACLIILLFQIDLNTILRVPGGI